MAKTTKPPKKLARARRAIAKVAAATGLVSTFGAALAVAVVLHADLPASRKLIARSVSHLVSNELEGSLTVDRIDELGVRGIDGGRATVRDLEGRVVLVAEGIRVRASWPELATALLFGGQETTLTVRRVRIEHAELTLTPDESGQPSLVRALSPKPAPPSASPEPEPSARNIQLWIPAVRIRQATLRGEVSPIEGAPMPLDALLANIRGSVLVGPEQTSIRAERFGLALRKLDARLVAGDSAKASTEARGTAELRIDLPSPSGAPLYGLASFDGFIDEVQASLRGSIDGDHIEIGCDLPRARPEELRALLPDLPIHDLVGVNVKIEGSLPHLEARARLRLGDGEVRAQGPVRLDDEPQAELELELQKLDVQAIEPSAPKTSIDGKGALSFRLPATGPQGSFDFRTEPTTVDGVALPSISARGSFDRERLETSATVHLPGMPTRIRKLSVRAAPKGAGAVVDFEADGDVPALQKAQPLAGLATGRAHWYARGTVSANKLDTHVGVLLNDVTSGDVKLEQAAIVGRVTGSLERPSIDASLVGQRVEVAGLAFRNARATALGPLTKPRIVASLEHDKLPLLTARGTVRASAGGGVIDGLELEAQRRDISVKARAKQVKLGAKGVEIPSFTLEGAGELDGSLRIGPDSLSLEARSPGLDIGVLLALLDARSEAAEAVRKTRNAALDRAFPILWGNYVDGMRISLDLGLEKNRAGERGHLMFSLDHASRTALPELRVHADLGLEGKQIRGSGITLSLGELASVTALPDGATLAGSLFDAASWERVTGKLSIRSSVDFENVHNLANLLPDGIFPFRKLGGTLSTRLSLRRDDGDSLPDLELSTTTKGFEVIASPAANESADAGPWASQGLDISVSGSVGWQEERARLRAVLAHEGRDIAELVAEAEPPFAEILAEPRRARSLLMNAPLAVHFRMPRTKLASLPSFLRLHWFEGDVELTGDLHGSLDTPIVTLEAGGYGLVSRDRGDVPLVVGAYATYGYSETEAQLRVTEPSGGDVTVSANVHASLDELVSPPALDDDPTAGYGERLQRFLFEKARADARIRANAFRVAPFHPLVSHVFSQLDGHIDGSFRIHQEPGEAGVRRTVDGLADIRGGVFQLPEIGQELHDATAHIVADGSPSIHVKDLSASGVTGRVTGEVTVTHRNLAFESMSGSFHITEKERLPLTLEGVSFGDAWGRVNVHMRPGKDDGGFPATLVDVDIPELHVDLPESSTRNVQSLGDNPKIRIGRRDFDGELVPVALGPEKDDGDESRWLVHFRLGDRVTLKQGNLLQIGITGAPRMAMTDRAYVNGDVWLTGGHVEVFGKRFEIVHGSARFHPATDASNPWVAVSARWDAPDATRVYADYVGPIKTGTLTLRSEPARTPSEILALVLLGSVASDLEASAQQGEAGQAAAGVGSSLATAGLNRVLSGVTGATITTRVDTSVAQNPRPEVAIRLSDSVTAEVAYSTGLPAPGQNPDRVLVTLGWHFRQRWSLSTTVGDKGSSVVDVIWQYRY